MKRIPPGLQSILDFEPKLARLRERYRMKQIKTPPYPTTANLADPVKIARIKKMIRNGTYDTHAKLDAILDAFIRDIV